MTSVDKYVKQFKLAYTPGDNVKCYKSLWKTGYFQNIQTYHMTQAFRYLKKKKRKPMSTQRLKHKNSQKPY